MNDQSLIIALILCSLGLSEAISLMHHRGDRDPPENNPGKLITVTVNLNRGGVVMQVGDGITVRELAQRACKSNNIGYHEGVTRIESKWGPNYSLGKTLAQAGISDGTEVKLKFWNRLEDAIAHIPIGRRFQ